MKKLYKSRLSKKLCGVCGGLGEYFNVDPTIVRLIWVIITCFSVGMGLIVYFICALIMDYNPSHPIDY